MDVPCPFCGLRLVIVEKKVSHQVPECPSFVAMVEQVKQAGGGVIWFDQTLDEQRKPVGPAVELWSTPERATR